MALAMLLPRLVLADLPEDHKRQRIGLCIPPFRSYGKIFQNAFLYFLHAVVVLVENLLGMRQAEVILGVFAPRQIYQRLQIVELDRVVWL